MYEDGQFFFNSDVWYLGILREFTVYENDIDKAEIIVKSIYNPFHELTSCSFFFWISLISRKNRRTLAMTRFALSKTQFGKTNNSLPPRKFFPSH